MTERENEETGYAGSFDPETARPVLQRPLLRRVRSGSGVRAPLGTHHQCRRQLAVLHRDHALQPALHQRGVRAGARTSRPAGQPDAGAVDRGRSSVEDLSEGGGPFLGVDQATFHRPVHPGDTLVARSTVAGKRVGEPADSASSPGALKRSTASGSSLRGTRTRTSSSCGVSSLISAGDRRARPTCGYRRATSASRTGTRPSRLLPRAAAQQDIARRRASSAASGASSSAARAAPRTASTSSRCDGHFGVNADERARPRPRVLHQHRPAYELVEREAPSRWARRRSRDLHVDAHQPEAAREYPDDALRPEGADGAVPLATNCREAERDLAGSPAIRLTGASSRACPGDGESSRATSSDDGR